MIVQRHRARFWLVTLIKLDDGQPSTPHAARCTLYAARCTLYAVLYLKISCSLVPSLVLANTPAQNRASGAGIAPAPEHELHDRGRASLPGYT
jgi:hypothetical protein